MLDLAAPLLLLLLPAPLLVWRFVPPHKDRARAVRVPFFRRLTVAADITPQAGTVVLTRRKLQMVVATLTWFLIVLSLARPERLGEPVTTETSARDIVLALDISGSMDERDFEGTDGQLSQRLEAVKDVLKGFIQSRSDDRISLIIFGTRAFVQAPFTEDLDSLIGFLDQTEVGMAGPNTALGDAIGLAIRSFEASDVEDRLLLLLSDGADTSSRMTPANAADIAANRGVIITTIGVGDPRGSGENRVDLDLLERIANQTGGTYFYADDAAALEQVYQQIDAQTPRLVSTQTFRPSDSLAHIPLGLATVLVLTLAAYMTLSTRRRARL